VFFAVVKATASSESDEEAADDSAAISAEDDSQNEEVHSFLSFVFFQQSAFLFTLLRLMNALWIRQQVFMILHELRYAVP
jgi:hypothetical protein